MGAIRRIVVVAFVVAIAGFLASCVTRSGSMAPVNKISPSHQARQAPSFTNEAILVLGLRSTGPSLGGETYRYAVASVEGSRVDGNGVNMWRWAYSPNDLWSGSPRGEMVDYQILRVPPGNYVLAYVQRGDTLFPLVRATGASRATLQNAYSGQTVQCLSIDLQGGQSTTDTPFLSVRANEVVYVGDLIVDFSDAQRPTVALGATPDGARRALAHFKEARPMTERAMRRVAGVEARPVPGSISLRPLPARVPPC
jgi:hypothetical protein